MNREAIRGRNNVRVQGEGPRTIVLAHGLGTDQSTWSAVAGPLSRDYRILTFDHVGAGGSDRSRYTEERYETRRSSRTFRTGLRAFVRSWRA